MAEARVAKFCTEVEYIKCKPWDNRLPSNGRGKGYVTHFFKFCPNHIFVIGEAMQCKCHVARPPAHHLWQCWTVKGVFYNFSAGNSHEETMQATCQSISTINMGMSEIQLLEIQLFTRFCSSNYCWSQSTRGWASWTPWVSGRWPSLFPHLGEQGGSAFWPVLHSGHLICPLSNTNWLFSWHVAWHKNYTYRPIALKKLQFPNFQHSAASCVRHSGGNIRSAFRAFGTPGIRHSGHLAFRTVRHSRRSTRLSFGNPGHFLIRHDPFVGSCYLTPSTPASHIKGAYTRWGVVQHRSGFGPDFALLILALVLVVWCVVTVL